MTAVTGTLLKKLIVSRLSQCPEYCLLDFLSLCGSTCTPILSPHCMLQMGSDQEECSLPFSVTQVLQQIPGPEGPILHLSPTFASRDNQDKLEQFIRQFICN